MFSEYCERKFEVEPVKVVYANGSSQIYPDLSDYTLEVPLSYITSQVGIKMEANEVWSSLCNFINFLTITWINYKSWIMDFLRMA